jgi:Holliday junction resolvase RusA-like endonuclease
MTVEAPLRLWLPGRPRAWTRTRGRGSSRFNDPAYATWLEETGWLLRSEIPEPLTGQLAVDIEVFEDGTSLVVSESSRSRPIKQRGDLDNIVKGLLDAGNRVAWDDDRQVSVLRAQFNSLRGPPRSNE